MIYFYSYKRKKEFETKLFTINKITEKKESSYHIFGNPKPKPETEPKSSYNTYSSALLFK